jgi:hypothetical protein
MHRRNFIKLGVGSAAATALIGLVPVPKPYDAYQEFLNSIGHKIHALVLQTGRPMHHVVIEGEHTSLDETNFYRLVRVYLEGQVQPHEWFEKVAY